MNHVGVGLRAVATTIDIVVLGVVGYVVALFTGGTTEGGFALEGAPAFLTMLIFFAYYIVMEAQFGWTLGKRALGLRVVKVGGAPLDWQASIVRNLLRIVDGLFFYLIGAIVIWTSDQKQRLGDKLASTAVIRSGDAA